MVYVPVLIVNVPRVLTGVVWWDFSLLDIDAFLAYAICNETKQKDRNKEYNRTMVI